MSSFDPERTCVFSSLDQPLLGTAPHHRAYLLLELKKPWPRKIHKARNFLEGLEDLDLQVIATPAPAERDPKVFLYRVQHGQTWKQELPLDLERIQAALDGPPQGRPCPPELWVCTHGSRDACCARLGVPLLQMEVGSARRRVECSHLGGHRFAPVLLALPEWRCFGRVGRQEFDGFLTRLDAGEALPEYHRGKVRLPAPLQVVEGELWHRFGPALEGVKILNRDPDTPAVEACIGGAWRCFQAEVGVEKVEGIGSCRDFEGGPKILKQYSLKALKEFAPGSAAPLGPS